MDSSSILHIMITQGDKAKFKGMIWDLKEHNDTASYEPREWSDQQRTTIPPMLIKTTERTTVFPFSTPQYRYTQTYANVHVHAQPCLQSRLTGFRHNNNSGQDSIIRTEELHNIYCFRLWILASCQLQYKEIPMYKLIRTEEEMRGRLKSVNVK